MAARRLYVAIIGTLGLCLSVVACGAQAPDSSGSRPSQHATAHQTGSAPADKRTDAYCAQNHDANCAAGTYLGPHAAPGAGAGYWDNNGNPVDGGPVGADGSTGNNVSQEYCARNEDPACPAGSYVGPKAIKNPDGSNSYVPCEGTVCTNPNHGGGDNSGVPGNTDSPDPSGAGQDSPSGQ